MGQKEANPKPTEYPPAKAPGTPEDLPKEEENIVEKVSILSLPDPVIVDIMQRLSTRDILHFSEVCGKIRKILQFRNGEKIWKNRGLLLKTSGYLQLLGQDGFKQYQNVLLRYGRYLSSLFILDDRMDVKITDTHISQLEACWSFRHFVVSGASEITPKSIIPIIETANDLKTLEIVYCPGLDMNFLLQKISIFNFNVKHLRLVGATLSDDYSIQCLAICGILSLEMNYCILSNSSNVENLSNLVQLLQSLQYLSLEGTNIKNLIIKSNTLNHLNLRKTEISDKDLNEMIVHSPQLQVLDIGENPITDKAITSVLEKCPKLEVIGVPIDIKIEEESLKNKNLIKDKVYNNPNFLTTE